MYNNFNIKFIFDIIDSQIEEYRKTLVSLNPDEEDAALLECYQQGKISALQVFKESLKDFIKFIPKSQD